MGAKREGERRPSAVSRIHKQDVSNAMITMGLPVSVGPPKERLVAEGFQNGRNWVKVCGGKR